MATADSAPTLMTYASPLITAAFVSIAGLIAWTYQKSVERENAYKDSLRTRYEQYFYSILDAMDDTQSPQKNVAFQQARVSLRLYASHDTLKKVQAFETRIIGSGARSSTRGNQLAADLLTQMRLDVIPGRKRKQVDSDEMMQFTSFNVR